MICCTLVDRAMQEVMEGWGGDVPVAGLSAEAAQAIRDAAQEDFEVYEASDEDPGMEEAAGDLSEEGRHLTFTLFTTLLGKWYLPMRLMLIRPPAYLG